MPIRYEVVEMTPERAAQLLENRPANRTVREQAWRRLALQMRNGLWVENGDTIRISESGGLIDGQHRLYAVVSSGVTVPMTLALGVPVAAMTTMDTGIVRTLPDFIKIAHPEVTQVSAVASATRLLEAWDLGGRGPTLRPGGGSNRIVIQQNATTSLAYFEAHETEIREAVAHSDRYIRAGLKIPRAILATAVILTERKSAEDAEFFWDKMKTGAGLEIGSPMLSLRSKVASKPRDEAWQPDYWLALIIKSWNKYRSGEEMLVARFRRGGASPEAFPELV